MQTASTATKYNVTQPEWREKFHLCVFESNQVLKLVIAHNMEYSARWGLLCNRAHGVASLANVSPCHDATGLLPSLPDSGVATVP